MKKKIFYSEVAYIIGVITVAFGVVCETKANFGMSMIVLPAYVLYNFLKHISSFFSFGVTEYILQAIMIIGMIIVIRKFKISYFFSFVTAVIYGYVLDLLLYICGESVPNSIILRIGFFVLGMLSCALGVSSMFHTYIAPESYELFVKEVSLKFNKDIHKFKTGYDIVSLCVGIGLSLILFGLKWPIGLNIGTVILAIVNGYIISLFSKFYNNHFEFKDAFPKFKKLFDL